ncbi:MAG: carbonic anhydrase [Rhodospirillales bacterium]|nr:carbonic anhydrase [Rhodospirillales bacterium]
MDALLAGYRRFRARIWPNRRRRFETLAAQGQNPRAMVVACADSRVDPAMIFDAGPGEIFTVRNVANLIPPCQPDGAWHGTSAALEFGVAVLRVAHLIVLGHGLCGGIRALLDGVADRPGGFIGPWIRLAEPVRALACKAVDPQLEGEYAVVRLSLANLMTFPWVAERVASGELQLHGAHFDIRTGVLAVLDADGTFRRR